MRRILLTLALALLALPVPARATPAPLVVIVMENHEYGSIVGSGSAPYLNGTFIPAGKLFTNYFANAHPSLPNYLDMTAGTNGGCTNDKCSVDAITFDNIFHQLGRNWGAYEDSMGSNCRGTNAHKYVTRHNPSVYFTDLNPSPCNTLDTPNLPSPLPKFTFITPNVCNDMHSCSVSVGDAWLAAHVPGLLSSGAEVVITFDEGSSNKHGGGKVMTAVVGPGIRARTTDATLYSHFSLLAGLEAKLGLARLAGAQTATPLPI